MKTQKGYFITFEGGEGTGKSSQINQLVRRLQTANISVTQTREPGGVPSAEMIRQLLVTSGQHSWDSLTEALLQFAARRENYIKCIQPALHKGNWVICDRFVDSTFAYQGAGQGVDREILNQLVFLTLKTFKPDLTFILDTDVSIGLARSDRRLQETHSAENRFEKMDQSFHQRVREAFKTIAIEQSDRCIVVDASLPMETVHNHIWSVIQHRFLS